MVDGVVYLASHESGFDTRDSLIYALDSETGDELWRYDAVTSVFFSPAVVEGVLYGGSIAGHLYALDAKTGEERWRFQTEKELWRFPTGLGVASTPAVVDGVVYFGTDWSLMFGVDAETGEELWRHETESGAMWLHDC